MMNAYEYFSSVGFVLAVMAVVALLEVTVPLFVPPAAPGRRRANLAMTINTLLFTFLLTAAVGWAAVVLPLASPGLMAALALPGWVQFVVGIVALDFVYGYAAHRTMHGMPRLWRFHRVHHSDLFVDATTSYRTHPVELVWRHLWLFGTVWILGVPAAAVAAFRVVSAANAILEHANVRVPQALDAALSWVWVTPQMHKIHHSRDQLETDSNYGNVLSLADRVLGTFVPTQRAFSVRYGLDDVNAAEFHSFAALLAMPWRLRSEARGEGAAGHLETQGAARASAAIGD